jgi:hypothetical protein
VIEENHLMSMEGGESALYPSDDPYDGMAIMESDGEMSLMQTIATPIDTQYSP